MTISANMVKELRERTGAAMMDCKKALTQTDGDMEKAIELMRKSGQAKADKKAGRVAAEGVIQMLLSDDQKRAVIIEINCETDFVGRDENFLKFAQQVAAAALANKVNDVAVLSNQVYQSGNSETVEEIRQQLVAKIGENISIRRLQYVTSEYAVASYSHGGRIGVLVEVNGGSPELHKDIAMHIAANNPVVINQSDVPADAVAKEKEIFMAQAQASGKPADIINKMIEGRIKKYLDEVSLLGQPFVKNPDISVAKRLQEENATVVSFIRYAAGEGIEKQVTNFAEEVMAQVNSTN